VDEVDAGMLVVDELVVEVVVGLANNSLPAVEDVEIVVVEIGVVVEVEAAA